MDDSTKKNLLAVGVGVGATAAIGVAMYFLDKNATRVAGFYGDDPKNPKFTNASSRGVAERSAGFRPDLRTISGGSVKSAATADREVGKHGLRVVKSPSTRIPDEIVLFYGIRKDNGVGDKIFNILDVTYDHENGLITTRVKVNDTGAISTTLWRKRPDGKYAHTGFSQSDADRVYPHLKTDTQFGVFGMPSKLRVLYGQLETSGLHILGSTGDPKTGVVEVETRNERTGQTSTDMWRETSSGRYERVFLPGAPTPIRPLRRV